MEYQIGQIVYSKCGRDKGDIQIVLSIAEEYLLLIDGKHRKLENPKRKKMKHVQPTKYIDESLANKIVQGAYLLDADIRKAIKAYLEEQ